MSRNPRMHFGAPSIGKGIRGLFRRFGYTVYLVNEYYTSKKCNHGHNTEPAEHSDRGLII